MSTVPDLVFKSPPVVQCIAQEHCLGIGKKIHSLDNICNNCLKRHDPQQLRVWANNNTAAIELVEEEALRKQDLKQNLKSYGRYLCALEDPDYQHCHWRKLDLNLRGTRLDCTTVRKKGKACDRCWKRHLRKIRIIQYFTPTGLCHEEADKVVTRPEELGEGIGAGDDDVKGYSITFH